MMNSTDVIRWTYIWWLLDGLGLLVVAYRLRYWLAVVPGLAGTAIGVAAMCLSLGKWPDALGTVSHAKWMLLGYMIAAVLYRYAFLDSRRLEKRWKSAGSPTVWDGIPLVLVCAAGLTAIFITSLRANVLSFTEYILWSWVIGGFAAGAFSQGGYGLALNVVTKWLLRISIPVTFFAGVAMLVR